MSTFGLPKNERLSSKKDISYLFDEGAFFNTASGRLRSGYVLVPSEFPGFYAKTAFIVPKKSGKAFWRNRLRRLLKEAYRLNKHILSPAEIFPGYIYHIVLINIFFRQQKHPTLRLSDVSDDVIELLSAIRDSGKRISSNSNR
ncbi:MAG: ribonuclease P protein component [Ignavibacteriales bacterium]|nr:ribonuclease P protein component [Ignavibacteriales bacterium]MCF8306647.1 ribonuclease P protein component [Ignavibacteriales bacterium]MCF8316253.1 ribonuclease P protein component [Ignavibacteriales bacterium]MCF8437837.1 ribonuclease P protein component [Ignavibacteriales bacterium]